MPSVPGVVSESGAACPHPQSQDGGTEEPLCAKAAESLFSMPSGQPSAPGAHLEKRACQGP